MRRVPGASICSLQVGGEGKDNLQRWGRSAWRSRETNVMENDELRRRGEEHELGGGTIEGLVRAVLELILA